MSLLDRLEIRGIRSYGPERDDAQIIKFLTPLTLVLGDNGCGKTTIIEALKFATSGGLPSGSRMGHNFVYYPKLENLPEVVGSVKLRFHDVHNHDVTVHKLAKRQLSGATNKFARVDSTLTRVDENGKISTVTGRANDVDNEACISLGVSKSILENVIFCQQDESNWPLDEPKRLKEKFDAIFNTTGYNSVIDKIRVLVKNRQSQLKVKIERLKVIQERQVDLNSKKKLLQSKEIQKVDIEFSLKDIEESLDEKTTEIKLLTDKKIEIDELRDSIGKLDVQTKHTKQQIVELKKMVKVDFQGSMEALKSEIDNYKQQMRPDEDELDKIGEEKDNLVAKSKKMATNISRKQIKLGTLIAEQEQFKKLQNEQDTLIEQLKDNKIVAEPNVVSLRKILQMESAKLKEKFDKKHAKEKALQDLVNECDLETCKITQTIELRSKQLSGYLKEINMIKATMKKYEQGQSMDLLDSVNKEFEEVDGQLKRVEDQFDDESLKRDTADAKRTKDAIDVELGSIQKNLVVLEKIELKKKSVSELQDNVQSFLEQYETFLADIKWNHENRTTSLTKVLSNLERKYTEELNKLKSKLNDFKNKVTIDRAEKDRKEKLIVELTDEIATIKKKVENQCKGPISTFEEVFSDSQVVVEKLQKKIAHFSSSKSFYEGCIDVFQHENATCPTCQQKVDGDSKRKSIVANLQKTIIDIPSNLKKLRVNLKDEEGQMKKLADLKHLVTRYYSLLNEKLPEVKSELAEFLKTIDKNLVTIDELTNSMKEPENELKLMNKMLKVSNMYDSNVSKKDVIDKEIIDLEKQLSKNYKTMNLSELTDKQQRLREQFEAVNERLDNNREKHTKHMNEVSQLQNKRANLLRKISKIQEDNREYVMSDTKLREIDDEVKRIREEVVILEADLIPKQDELSKLKIQKQEFLDVSKQELDANRDYHQKIENLVNNLIKNCKNMEQNKGIHLEVSSNEEELKVLEKNQEAILNKIKDLDVKIKTINDGTMAVTMKLRELNDIFRLRMKKDEFKKLLEQADNLSISLKKLKVDDVEASLAVLKKSVEKIQQNKYEKFGFLKQLKETIEQINEEISHPRFANTDQEYMEMLLDVKSEERVIDDLKMYATALEWSVMQFHKAKMIQINEIISRLWMNIYRGNDFNNIIIRTDETVVKGPSSKRSYNYRLVYVKKGTEMEMRGHCSAGQKVLASLIIRIALSEIFNSHCGVLTLDEPTTNLDRENVFSLCDALAEIIKEKQSTNFQLILITHDEEFVNQISRVCDIESFYKVTRNAKGKSEIKIESSDNLS